MMTILAAVLGFVTIAGLGFAFAGGGDSSENALKRAQTFTAPDAGRRIKSGATPRREGKASDPESRRKQIMAQLKEVEERDRKARVTIAAKLRQAGVAMAPRTFWLICLGVGLVIAPVLTLVTHKPLIGLGCGFAAGLGLPRWVLGFLAKKRAKKFTGEFPNAVDVIVRGIKSGLPVHDCLKIIGKESTAPLGPEFQRLVENIGMGVSLEQGLEKMYERMPTSELRFFTIVIAIQQKAGGNLAEALGNLSTVLRSRALMREKIKAMSSEATASAGIIGSLPPAVMLMVSLVNPSYIGMLFTDPRGNLMLLGGGLWMTTGVLVMKKMISFKI
ncbi:type II secretion system F family protein [Caulobacter sp. 17J65-9]|uniref:type II secretion system F family protein n=1 Tax=Caulobacter sp. 17J65-9 TaxID=2709382 RepID=UPI0013C6F32B|nr:type II secretion system F family protein [Caulobacter sp. 17J65-9]NEX94752.1 type II secretion system F family protein [Caulobacter sp. 17J65-9]